MCGNSTSLGVTGEVEVLEASGQELPWSSPSLMTELLLDMEAPSVGLDSVPCSVGV